MLILLFTFIYLTIGLLVQNNVTLPFSTLWDWEMRSLPKVDLRNFPNREIKNFLKGEMRIFPYGVMTNSPIGILRISPNFPRYWEFPLTGGRVFLQVWLDKDCTYFVYNYILNLKIFNFSFEHVLVSPISGRHTYWRNY